MPKCTKKFIEIDKPIWPYEDPDIHEIVRVAFLNTFPSMMQLGIYHVIFHDTGVNHWTASVSANAFGGSTEYFQLYHDGTSSVFLTRESDPH